METLKSKKLKKYPGGCAIMINCRPMRSHDAAFKLVGLRPEWKMIELGNHHLTLQFFGRDLSGQKIARIITSAFGFAEEAGPITLNFSGRLEILATERGRYLAASVEPDEKLKAIHSLLLSHLSTVGIERKSPLHRPHVTLAEAPPGPYETISLSPFNVSPYSAECSELTVKYGRYRMTIELGKSAI